MAIRVAFLLAFLLAGSATSLTAQLASMVRDLRTQASGGSSSPYFLGFASDTAYFIAEAPGVGLELWRSDGTPESTRLVGDRCPGDCDTYYKSLGQAEDRLFLAAYGSYATEVLVARGNPPALESILAESESLYLAEISGQGDTALLSGRLLFWAISPAQTAELYSARGPGADLVLLARFEGSGRLGQLQRSGAVVYFWNYPLQTPAELWVTDGTASGTRRIAVLDIQNSVEVAVGVGAQSLLFAAHGQEGSELWISNGSAVGTHPISNLPDPEARFWSMVAAGERAYFLVEDLTFGQELWTTDGTGEGTGAITAFGFHEPFGTGYSPDQVVLAGDRAYFFATNGIDGEQLWSTSTSGSSAFALTGACTLSICYYDRDIYAVGAQVFFENEDVDHGVELWTTDGTTTGTRVMEDTCPGSCGGFGAVLSTAAGRLVYSATPGGAASPTLFIASPPWLGATTIFDPLRGAPVQDYYDQGPALDSGNRIYFSAADSLGGTEPWVTQGNPQTSFQLADIWGPQDSGSYPYAFVAAGDTVAFRATYSEDGGYGAIWLTEGTAGSTRRPEPDSYLSSNPYTPIEALADRYFTLGYWGDVLVVDPEQDSVTAISTGNCDSSLASGVLDGVGAAAFWCEGRTQLWRTDGTEAGTSPTLTLPQDFGIQSAFQTVGHRLLFVGGTDAPRLYSVPAAMNSMTPLTAADAYFDSLIVPDHENLAFFDLNSQIWRTDGTPGGTFAVAPPSDYLELKAAAVSPAGYDLVVRNSSSFYEIWSTDGTAAGTHFRAAVGPSYPYANSIALDRAGDDLYLIVSVSDASATLLTLPDGSTQPRALQASVAASDPTARSLAHNGDREYFSGCDAQHGCELWTSDGTEAGTRLLHDISPGPASSSPSELFSAGGRLYFRADDGRHGNELWVLPFDDGPACRESALTLCLEGGRFQVAATWRDFAGRSGDATAVPITGDTGYFWFFDEDNVELILKLIDGGGFNGHHWVYYGALSNVEYTFTVTDSETGAAKRYFNPATRFASSGDITAFGPNGAHAAGGPAEAMTRAAMPPEVSLAAFSAPQGLPGACVPTPTRFCILNNRFAVTATWRDFAGHTGTANAGTLTDDTGYLWFFNEANVEVVLKMVDAGSFNQHFWVYYGALSNVEYTLTVTDTVAGGPPRVYHNALGQFGSFGDIEAFPAP